MTGAQGIFSVPAGRWRGMTSTDPTASGRRCSHFRAGEIQIYCHLHSPFPRAAPGVGILLVLPSLKPSPALGNTVQFSNSWIFVSFHEFYFLKLSNIPAKLLMDLHFQIQLIRQQFSVKLTTLALPSLFLWRDRFLKLFELLQSYSGFTILQWQKKF